MVAEAGPLQHGQGGPEGRPHRLVLCNALLPRCSGRSLRSRSSCGLADGPSCFRAIGATARLASLGDPASTNSTHDAQHSTAQRAHIMHRQ